MERTINMCRSKLNEGPKRLSHGKFILFISPISRKTNPLLAFTLNSAVKETQPTLYLSLEMESTALITHLIEESAGIGLGRVQDGMLSPEEFHKFRNGAELVAKAPLFIQDHTPVELDTLQSIISEAKTTSEIEIVVIDYPALLKIDGVAGSTQRLKKICAELSHISKVYNITVVGTIIQPRSGSIPDEEELTSLADEVIDLRLGADG